jgi:hypothetical protein
MCRLQRGATTLGAIKCVNVPAQASQALLRVTPVSVIGTQSKCIPLFFIAADYKKWGQLIKTLGLKVQ